MKYIYRFGSGRADGHGGMKDLLGGKGAGLAEMTRSRVPVPAGFTITTTVCKHYLRKKSYPPGFQQEFNQAVSWLQKVTGKRFNQDFALGSSPPRSFDFAHGFDFAHHDPERSRTGQDGEPVEPKRGSSSRLGLDSREACPRENGGGNDGTNTNGPLLVSVRSGAKFSMPGMMDTILNLGINDRVVEILARKNSRFSWDAYRRFIAMFSATAMGLEKKIFEGELAHLKQGRKAQQDTDLSADDLKELVSRYKEIYKRAKGEDFPQDPLIQLEAAREAVFRSWMNPRAQGYRKLNKIPDDLGTAVNVVEMVFGNLGWDSGTGVGFTRNPSNGKKEFYGEYLANAQGEDVVAGIRTPKAIAELKKEMPQVYRQLRLITSRLEKHYHDIQDFEFTIEDGKLFMLQTRTGKRTALAALKIAVDMAKERLITKKEAILRVDPKTVDELLKPVFNEGAKADFKVLAKGLPAGPGAACGRVIFDAKRAVEESGRGPVILVRSETNPDDILGMAASQGILTQTGGLTSHAAVVGRGMGKVCVVGCEAIRVDEKNNVFSVNGSTVREGEFISLDGFSGEVIKGEVPLRQSEIMSVLAGEKDAHASELYHYYKTFMSWADEVRRLGIRANGDTPQDAKVARLLGAKGIGLCRTEHMFFGEERIPHVVGMILASTSEERKAQLEKLFQFQKEDFKAILKEMAPYPVTIRTLDPPLHEFLPKTLELAQERARALGVDSQKLWRAACEFHEVNPMLGFRGVRLGLVYPEITEMQGRAIMTATAELLKEGVGARPEIMIPLVGFEAELKSQRELLLKVKQEVELGLKVKLDIPIGTMIEVPRAAVCADTIVAWADFLSFGTNDLTQMTLGFSRDDYGRFINKYMEDKIIAADPFATLDIEGVGELVRWAVTHARAKKRKIKIGVCGEHGGDPESIHFFNREGFDYVSSSPYRVPVARIAAAQAELLKSKTKGSDTR